MIAWVIQALHEDEPRTGIWIAAIAGCSAVAVAVVTLIQNILLSRRNKGDHGAVTVALQALQDTQVNMGGKVEDIFHVAHSNQESHIHVAKAINLIHDELHHHVKWEESQKYMTPDQIDEVIRKALENHQHE